jgi:hypothetical protein
MKTSLTSFKDRSGQSLVEAIVAISILTVGLLGMVNLLTKSLSLNSVAASDTQATYLAAEGIEVTKNLIDHDVYLYLQTAGGSGGWGTTCFGTVPIGGSKDYEADYTTTGCPTVWSGSGRFLKIDSSSHLYSYTAAITTPFTRRIRVSRPTAQEIEVQSIVTWNVVGASQNIILDDHFYNWRLP